ncbi:uncharacterized protein N7458_008002 [Penicillium daleae]|uniref:Uncharacterized protein n=1 Tax=Penicillium daleae TaxID=63821 RepID=A0AAD6G1M8_9EURO|nr:uncharacterized protein N7458_008002 [Penicillium daleae]KAJ5444130.1 hypothetical protein N7458_008002 [Penicillium daleae]
MGLIKTGLALAGGYGLIKAASKAVNDYEDKKQRRSTQIQQQYYAGHEPQMGNMQGSQMCHQNSQPQWPSSSGSQSPQGNYTGNHFPHQMNPRRIQDDSKSHDNFVNQSPPPYHQGHAAEREGGAQPGSAQEYYSGKKF